MQPGEVPEPLSSRLGTQATAALAELLDRASQEQRTDMIAACSERFERRLVQELASIRVQLAQVQADLCCVFIRP